MSAPLVVGCVALALGGCANQATAPSATVDGSVSSVSPSSSEAGTPTADAEPEVDDSVTTERPAPPPEYEPSWPDQTVRTADGFPVNSCVPEDLHDHVVSLTAADDTHISALVLGEGENGVLLGHERGFSICSFLSLGQRLADRGFLVVLPEYRDHGASEVSTEQTVDSSFDLDAVVALDELQKLGAERVFVGGASCGGTTSAMAGAELADPVGLLMMSSPAQCGPHDAIPAVRHIDGPSLFVVSPGDMNGAVEAEVRELYQASTSPEKQLEIVEGGGHGTQLFRDRYADLGLEDDVLDFIVDTFP